MKNKSEVEVKVEERLIAIEKRLLKLECKHKETYFLPKPRNYMYLAHKRSNALYFRLCKKCGKILEEITEKQKLEREIEIAEKRLKEL